MSTASSASILQRIGVTEERLESLAKRVETVERESQSDGPGDERDHLTVRAPATDEVIGSVPACTEADVAAAVDRARAVGETWSSVSVADRAAIVDRFGELLLERREQLCDLVQLETGKARRHALEEILSLPNECTYYAERGPGLLADQRREPAIPLATTTRVTYDPVGVVGIISPWNYPLVLSVTDAIPALVAGCPVVLKPDERTPFTALALAELFEAAGLPPDAFTVVTGAGPVVGPALIDRVEYVAFTGGADTGRVVAERAGRNLIDCSLELGGKNPFVVLADADVEEAARGAVQAAFTNAGQLCLGAERFYVEEPLFEPFLEAFVERTEALSIELAFEYGPDVGSLIDGEHLESVETAVADAVEAGATVETGGRARPDVGPFVYEPTILTGVGPDDPIVREETFGPVVTVTSVPDVGSAIEAANDSPYGLNASVWTGDRDRGVAVARRIDAGSVGVNDGYVAGWAGVDAPMGGRGDSGVGARHGPEGLSRYLEARTITTSRVGPIADPPGVPKGWVARGLTAIVRLRTLLRRL